MRVSSPVPKVIQQLLTSSSCYVYGNNKNSNNKIFCAHKKTYYQLEAIGIFTQKVGQITRAYVDGENVTKTLSNKKKIQQEEMRWWT
jgi:hypothetical protein